MLTLRTNMVWRLILVILALFVASPADAQEYDGTNVWWRREAQANNLPVKLLGFAMPVLRGDKMVGAINLSCPRGSERGTFVDIPATLSPLPPGSQNMEQQPNRRIVVLLNSQAFAAYVDAGRIFVYFDDSKLPEGIPGLPPGKSVRSALRENKDSIRIRFDPKDEAGLTVRFNRSETQAGDLFNRLRAQGLQQVKFEHIVKLCDEYVKGK